MSEPLTFMVNRDVKSRNQMDKLHWSRRSKEMKAWLSLLRRSVPSGFDCGDNFATVRVISFRNRMLDDDNLAGGFKCARDAMKHARLLKDDSPKWCRFFYEQKPVKRGQGYTWIEVWYQKPQDPRTADTEKIYGKKVRASGVASGLTHPALNSDGSGE